MYVARGAPPLIEELGFHELAQPFLQAGLVHRRKGLEHFVPKFASEHGAELGHLAQLRQPVKPGREGSSRVAGILTVDSGPVRS